MNQITKEDHLNLLHHLRGHHLRDHHIVIVIAHPVTATIHILLLITPTIIIHMVITLITTTIIMAETTIIMVETTMTLIVVQVQNQ